MTNNVWRSWVIPVATVILLGLVLPLALIWPCAGSDPAIGGPGTCGYAVSWLDGLAVTVLDWIALSTMALGLPIVLVWLVVFLVARFLARRM